MEEITLCKSENSESLSDNSFLPLADLIIANNKLSKFEIEDFVKQIPVNWEFVSEDKFRFNKKRGKLLLKHYENGTNCVYSEKAYMSFKGELSYKSYKNLFRRKQKNVIINIVCTDLYSRLIIIFNHNNFFNGKGITVNGYIINNNLFANYIIHNSKDHGFIRVINKNFSQY